MNKIDYLNNDEYNSDTECNNIVENDINDDNCGLDEDIDTNDTLIEDNNNPNNYCEYKINDWLLTEFDYNQCNDDVVIKLVDLIDNFFNQFNNNIHIVNTTFINQFIPFLYKHSTS